MNYFTAAEMADKWKISSRMVAYYCESGRIEGVVKKGKTWFVPTDTPKPLDKRYFRDIIKAKESQATGDTLAADAAESAVYHTKDIFEHLGLTRETLRYYEEIGLIKPKRGQYSRYREFDLFDMSRLMAIDFYKKRGFSPVAIKGILEAEEPEEYAIKLQQQSDSLQEQIDRLSQMQKRLKETQRFYEEFSENLGKLEIRDLSPYYVAERFPSVASFGEYRDKVLRFLNVENEDILSSLVRTLTFDETGYKGSEMYVVKPAGKADHEKQNVYLEHGKCLYATLLADNDDTSVPERMFSLCHAWANKNQAVFRGMVYIFVRMAMQNEDADKHIYEVWVPLK